MELRQFVKETLVEIIEGVREAQNELASKDGSIHPRAKFPPKPEDTAAYDGKRIFNVHFDIAVTASEGSEVKGGAGINVFTVKIGAQGGSTESNVSQNRIQFDIPITYPYSLESTEKSPSFC